MLRISCICGKPLKINDDDDLAGKKLKVKCPACAALLLVTVPAAGAMATQPMKPAARGEEEGILAGSPARKTALVSDDEEALLRPKKKYRDDPLEDNGDGPRKRKKKAKKGASIFPLALVGGGALLFLGLIAAGIAAYFHFAREGSGVSKGADKGGDKAVHPGKMEPVAIKLHVPNYKGSVREVAAFVDKFQQEKITGIGPPKTNTVSHKIDWASTIKVLDIDQRACETKAEYTVKKWTADPPAGAGALLPGTVFVRQRDRLGHFNYCTSDGSPLPADQVDALLPVMGQREDTPSTRTNDDIFGTKHKQVVGNCWPVNIENFLEDFQEGAKGALAVKKEDASGTVKFVKVVEEDGKRYFDFEGEVALKLDNVDVKVDQQGLVVKVSGSLVVAWQARYPADFSTGPIMEMIEFDMNIVETFAGADGKCAQVNIELKMHVITETKYITPGDPKAPPSTALPIRIGKGRKHK